MTVEVQEHVECDEIIISGERLDDHDDRWYWHEEDQAYYTAGYGRGTWKTCADVWVTINC